MNHVDHEIEKVGRRVPETVISDRVAEIRKELDGLYAKAKDGTATQEDSDRCSELVWELRDLEG